VTIILMVYLSSSMECRNGRASFTNTHGRMGRAREAELDVQKRGAEKRDMFNKLVRIWQFFTKSARKGARRISNE